MLRGLVIALALFMVAAPAWGQALEVEEGSPLQIEKLTVRADVDEGVALVDVDQTFRNHTDAVQEGVYQFRLPEKAVVHSFSMWMNGREKHGRVLEATQARAIYDSIVRRKQDPALLEEIGWRRFQVSVFPIPARDTVRIRLVYAHVVDDDLGLRTLEIPLPEGSPVGVADVVVSVRDRQGVSVLDCPTHADADVLHDDLLGAVRWSREGFTPSGPFRVRSAPAVKGLGLACLTYRDEQSSEGTFLVRVVPRMDDVPDLPRDVVFVIDRSGSMKGRKLEQAQAALRFGLATLRPGDRFSIVAFSSGVQPLEGDELLPVTDETLDVARAYADSLTASGGTNIDAALQQAMSLRDELPGRLFVLSFLTDGNPTVGEKNPDRIVTRYRERSAGTARLFAFGVGDDVKDFLLTRLAADSRGAAEYVRENEDLEVKLSTLFEKVRSPILTDVSIRVTGDDVHVVGTEPEYIPDVFRGTAVVMAGRYSGSGPVKIHLSGRVGTIPVEAQLDADLPMAAGDKPHVAQIWARMRIDRLLDELRVHGMVEEIRQEIVALGLKYQVVTPYTSFLVVEDGIHIPDDGELARVPEGPGATPGSGDDGPTAHAFGRRQDGSGGTVPPDSREPSDPPPAPAGGPTTPGGETAGPTTGGGDAGGPTAGGGEDSGGAYRGPTSEVPPDSREPSDPPPSDSGRSTGPSDMGGGAVTGGGAGGPKTGGAGRPSSAEPSIGYAAWRFWWRAHRDSIYAPDRGKRVELSETVRRTIVLPALRNVALDPDVSFDVRCESQRALALWGDDAEHVRALALRMLEGKPADGEATFHKVCLENAPRLFLSTRLDGATRARLLAVVTDPGRDGSRVRAHAALTLGLGGDDPSGDTVRALVALAKESGPRSAPLRPATLLALGLLGDARASDEIALILADAAGTDIDRAYAADALGRIGATDRTDELLRLLADKKSAVLVRRAIPAALARLSLLVGDVEQRGLVRALDVSLRRDRDLSTRNAAAIALARIASAAAVEKRVRVPARKALLDEWRREDATQPFVALALGIVAAHGDSDAYDALRKVSPDAPPDLRGAVVIALGMGYTTDTPEWTRVARDAGAHPDLRRQVLESLAWTTNHVEGLSMAMNGQPHTPVRTALLRMLAIHGDDVAKERLLELVVKDGSEDERVYDALARVGDATVADRLADVVVDAGRRYSDRARALAARALGEMAGASDPRRRIAHDFPYRAYNEPIWAFMDWR